MESVCDDKGVVNWGKLQVRLRPKRHSRPLGGSWEFHKDIDRQSEYRKTYDTVNKIRSELKFCGGIPIPICGSASVARATNSTRDDNQMGPLFKKISTRVYSEDDDSRDINPVCLRQKGHSALMPTQACDVLGQYACTNCCHARQLLLASMETTASYPHLTVSSGLAPKPSDGPTSASRRGAHRRHGHHASTPQRRSSHLLPIWPITSSELQKRVMRKNSPDARAQVELTQRPVNSNVWND